MNIFKIHSVLFQNDIIKNFALVMSVIVKRVDIHKYMYIPFIFICSHFTSVYVHFSLATLKKKS